MKQSCLQVAYEVDILETPTGGYKASLGYQRPRQAKSDAVSFHHSKAGKRKNTAQLEAWSHGHLLRSARDVIKELEQKQRTKQNMWTDDDNMVLDKCKQAVNLEGDWIEWFSFVKAHHNYLPNDYCGPCFMVASDIGLSASRWVTESNALTCTRAGQAGSICKQDQGIHVSLAGLHASVVKLVAIQEQPGSLSGTMHPTYLCMNSMRDMSYWKGDCKQQAESMLACQNEGYELLEGQL